MGLQATIIFLSSLALISLIPPFIWHVKTKNVCALMTILWLFIYNLKSLVDAAVWSDTGLKFFNAWDGKIWCDIMIKLEVGAYVGIPCCIARIAFQLTRIIKAETILPNTTSPRYMLTELCIVTIPPFIAMLLSYFVQIIRYGILRYSGCQNMFSTSWVTIIVYALWPFLLSIVGLFFSCRLLIVFYIKRKDAKDILQCTKSGLTLTRFSRFIFFCFLIIIIMFPSSLYTFIKTCQKVRGDYSYPALHKTNSWWTIFRLANESPILSIWLFHTMSYCAFFIFGTSSDALQMYAQTLRLIGLGFIMDRYNMRVMQKRHNVAQQMFAKNNNKLKFKNSANTPTTLATTPGTLATTRYEYFSDDDFSLINYPERSVSGLNKQLKGDIEGGFEEYEIQYKDSALREEDALYNLDRTDNEEYSNTKEKTMLKILKNTKYSKESSFKSNNEDTGDEINFHYQIKSKE